MNFKNFKFNVIKKLFSIGLCLLVVVGGVFVQESHAAFEDIKLQGGSYSDVMDAKRIYKEENPDDKTIYECHHLIAKKALNLWADMLPLNKFNEFLVDDDDQFWAPAITMEKADHEKTLSYYNQYTKTPQQNQKANEYIEFQAKRIIYNGDIIGVLKYESDVIRSTFGHKYDQALDQVWQYINSLNFRHPNPHELTMINPYRENWFFSYKF